MSGVLHYRWRLLVLHDVLATSAERRKSHSLTHTTLANFVIYTCHYRQYISSVGVEHVGNIFILRDLIYIFQYIRYLSDFLFRVGTPPALVIITTTETQLKGFQLGFWNE